MQAEMSMTMTAKGFATAPISFTAFNPTAASSSSSAVSSDSASTVNAVLETRGKWGSLILLGLILLCLLRALALEAHVAKAEQSKQQAAERAKVERAKMKRAMKYAKKVLKKEARGDS